MWVFRERRKIKNSRKKGGWLEDTEKICEKAKIGWVVGEQWENLGYLGPFDIAIILIIYVSDIFDKAISVIHVFFQRNGLEMKEAHQL